MTHANELTISSCKNILLNIAQFKLSKAAWSMVVCSYSWLFTDIHVLIAVYILILFDTVTGFCKACKNENLSSGIFFRVVIKCSVYFILILTGRLVDKSVPIPFAATIIESFLVITEALSIMENLSQMGFPVPIKLVKLLKIFGEEKVKK